MQRLILSDSLFSIGLLLQEDYEIFTILGLAAIPSSYTDDPIDAISGSVVYRLDQDRLLV